jgi:hypothetical protein
MTDAVTEPFSTVLTRAGASAFHCARRERVLERETFRFGGLPAMASSSLYRRRGCQPDCPGLDPVTGDKLAAGTVPETPIDERWAALKALTPDQDDVAARPLASDTEKS